MQDFIINRKHKEDRPVLAICYDFDKTLSPDDMQAQGYIQSVKREVKEFWEESNALAAENDMDQNLAYMYKMVAEAEGNLVVSRENLAKFGENIKLFPGVETWFDRIKRYGEEQGVIIEHYIISSGLKEIIEGTSLAKSGCFEKIYASSFYFNERGAAKWPAQVVNYTNKTQFLFRIEKGVLDINDPGVNDSFAPDEIRIPFRNMIYIGDSDTDIPCMKLVTVNGGHSIAVYDPSTGDRAKAYKMMRENRIKFFAPADYSEDAELDRLVKAIIARTAANELLETKHYAQVREQRESDRGQSELQRQRSDLIIALSSSRSFTYTHSVVAKLRQQEGWTQDEREELFRIALHNGQVAMILTDPDVKQFFSALLGGSKSLSENARKVKALLEE